jgi:pyruvate/2-oxoglutarate/acetoin dehydrogenase E1 component
VNTETTTVRLTWHCGRCEKPYRTEPAAKPLCRCPEPVTALRPQRCVETVLPQPVRRAVRAAGPIDEARARFARRGKRVTVTFTGTVVDATIANGEHLTLFVEDADGRRHAINPLDGFTVIEAEEQP